MLHALPMADFAPGLIVLLHRPRHHAAQRMDHPYRQPLRKQYPPRRQRDRDCCRPQPTCLRQTAVLQREHHRGRPGGLSLLGQCATDGRRRHHRPCAWRMADLAPAPRRPQTPRLRRHRQRHHPLAPHRAQQLCPAARSVHRPTRRPRRGTQLGYRRSRRPVLC